MNKMNKDINEFIETIITFYLSVFVGLGVVFIGTYLKINIMFVLVIAFVYSASTGILFNILFSSYEKNKKK